MHGLARHGNGDGINHPGQRWMFHADMADCHEGQETEGIQIAFPSDKSRRSCPGLKSFF
jgi:hypothetical protein